MSLHDSPNYSLTGDEVAAFAALLRMESDISPTIGSLTQARLLDLMQGLTQIPYQHYSNISNAQLKGWIDALYNAIITTQTAYGCQATGLYIAYTYYRFNECCNFVNPDSQVDCQGGYPPGWQTPAGGTPFSYPIPPDSPFPWGAFCGLWRSPGQPASLVNDINTLMGQGQKPWGSNPPTNVIQAQMYSFKDLQHFQLALFDPAQWTDAPKLADNLSTMWTTQSTALTTLLGQKLQPDSCPFLLYLLTAQGTSTVKGDQQRANTIVTTQTDSPEYPNDILINQLIYHNLMYWADPTGSYVWNNAQLQSTLQALSDAIISNDLASQAIVTALGRQLKILTADASYPLQDPYAPNIDFNQRKTDTLAGLNSAWSSLNDRGRRQRAVTRQGAKEMEKEIEVQGNEKVR